MSRPSWWQRARGWLASREPSSPSLPPADATRSDEPLALTPEEAYLRHLLDRPAPPSGHELSDSAFWAALDKLQATRPRLARTLLHRFVILAPDHQLAGDALVLRLAELDALEEPGEAETLLRRLIARRPLEHAATKRAHALLGELAERAGRTDDANEHWNALLAVDIDHPLVRGRRARLVREPQKKNVAATGATVAGLSTDGDGAMAGRYRIVSEIGRGGAGAVYDAIDLELERHVALKVLHPQLRAGRRAQAARAWLEARTAAALRHPGIVAIFDLDEEKQLLAMELCGAGSLAHVVAAGPSDRRLTLARVSHLVETLSYLHRRGVVHGDLKPANLLLRRADDSALVIGDFGLARMLADTSSAPVAAGGTLGYLPPEGRRGERAPAGDLYSVGVLLVELLGGRAAIAERFGRALVTIETDAQLVEAAPAFVRPLIRALLHADPAARPTADETRRQLAMLASAP